MDTLGRNELGRRSFPRHGKKLATPSNEDGARAKRAAKAAIVQREKETVGQNRQKDQAKAIDIDDLS